MKTTLLLLAMALGLASADGWQALLDANATLKARVEAAEGPGTVPMLSNGDAVLVRTAFDAETIRATPLTPESLGPMCGAIGRSITAYAAFGMKHPDGGAKGDPTLWLQDEVSLGSAAGTICVQRVFHAMDASIAKSDPEALRRMVPALQIMRGGTTMMVQGVVAMLGLDGISPANQDLLLRALEEDSAVIAASFTESDRRQLERIVRDAIPDMPEHLRPRLERVADSFAATTCNRVCEAAGG